MISPFLAASQVAAMIVSGSSIAIIKADPKAAAPSAAKTETAIAEDRQKPVPIQKAFCFHLSRFFRLIWFDYASAIWKDDVLRVISFFMKGVALSFYAEKAPISAAIISGTISIPPKKANRDRFFLAAPVFPNLMESFGALKKTYLIRSTAIQIPMPSIIKNEIGSSVKEFAPWVINSSGTPTNANTMNAAKVIPR